MNWESYGTFGNSILRSIDDEFRISFQPRNPEYGEPETALIKDNKYYILEGDWRVDYENLISQGWDACYNFYLSNSEFKSVMSSDHEFDVLSSKDLEFLMKSAEVVLFNFVKFSKEEKDK